MVMVLMIMDHSLRNGRDHAHVHINLGKNIAGTWEYRNPRNKKLLVASPTHDPTHDAVFVVSVDHRCHMLRVRSETFRKI